jgi:hypothetical protein
VVDRTFAERFAADWIASWNSHDLDRILARCHDGIFRRVVSAHAFYAA